MTWPNVSQLQAWNSPVVSEYKVTATPTYFLLDKEGKNCAQAQPLLRSRQVPIGEAEVTLELELPRNE